jgi:outer membrane protein assembly factor BamB
MNSMTTVLDTTTVPGVRSLHRLAVLLAVISGLFCILFCTVLAINYHGLLSLENDTAPQAEALSTSDPSYRKPAQDSFNRLPTDYPSFLALRKALAQDKNNETLKTQIRELDWQLRTGYFKRRTAILNTTSFLMVSAMLFLVAVRTLDVLNRKIPDPSESSRPCEKNNSWHAAAALSWLMLFGGFYFGLLLMPSYPVERMFRANVEQMFREKLLAESTVAAPAGRNETATVPVAKLILTEEKFRENWVAFRNYDGNGIGFSDNPPTHWDGKTGKNIVWKSEVPLPGNSSPVIWENQLFLTGANENEQQIFCYDIENGNLLWTVDVTRKEAETPKVDADTGFAAPTPVVDGRHVYAMFANGELVAVDLAGNFVWRKSFGTPDNHYGYANSLALHFDRLIVQFDDGDGSEGNSKLIAFALDNGDVLWETPREELHSTWSSPTIKKIGDSYQIITCANPFVIAYDPDNGKELWRCRCLNGGDVGPSAISLGNTVLIANESPRVTALDATGSGDVTATHILWTGVNAMPDTSSPLATEEYFLTLSPQGYLTGYNPKAINPSNKRAQYWELEVGETASIYSSPLRVGTYIYIFDKTKDNPLAFVIDLSKVALDESGSLTDESAAAMTIAENPMPEPCVTSPAMLRNRLYIRGATTIYCIGER